MNDKFIITDSIKVKRVITDSRFFRIKTLSPLVVPEWYKSENQLAYFLGRCLRGSIDFDENITEENFSRVSHQLIPGKKYSPVLVGIKPGVTASFFHCLKFYEKIGAYFIGAQGMTFVQECKADEFPRDKLYTYMSFDQGEKLWKSKDGLPRVPSMTLYLYNVSWSFFLGPCGSDWRDNHCLLCLCDL